MGFGKNWKARVGEKMMTDWVVGRETVTLSEERMWGNSTSRSEMHFKVERRGAQREEDLEE